MNTLEMYVLYNFSGVTACTSCTCTVPPSAAGACYSAKKIHTTRNNRENKNR